MRYPPRSQTPRTTVPPSFRSGGPGAENRPNGPVATDGTTDQNTYPPPPSPPPPPPFATAYRSGETPTKKDYTFPPAPQVTNNGTAFATPLLIKPPASALARALNIASKKLFGSPTNFADQASSGSPGSITKRESDHYSSNPNSPRFVVSQLPDSDSASGKTGGARPGSPAQDDLLLQLEALAHKAHVLAEWADKKFDKVEASPSSMRGFSLVTSHRALTTRTRLLQNHYLTQPSSSNAKGRHHIVQRAGENARSRLKLTRFSVFRCTLLSWLSRKRLST